MPKVEYVFCQPYLPLEILVLWGQNCSFYLPIGHKWLLKGRRVGVNNLHLQYTFFQGKNEYNVFG